MIYVWDWGNCVFVSSKIAWEDLTILPFRDHSLHKCQNGEELVYWLNLILILRFV